MTGKMTDNKIEKPTEKPFFVFITDNELAEIMSDNKIYMTESEVKAFYNICNLLFKRRGYKPKYIKEIKNGLKTIEIGADRVFTNAGTKEKTTGFVRSAYIQDIRHTLKNQGDCTYE